MVLSCVLGENTLFSFVFSSNSTKQWSVPKTDNQPTHPLSPLPSSHTAGPQAPIENPRGGAPQIGIQRRELEWNWGLRSDLVGDGDVACNVSVKWSQGTLQLKIRVGAVVKRRKEENVYCLSI